MRKSLQVKPALQVCSYPSLWAHGISTCAEQTRNRQTASAGPPAHGPCRPPNRRSTPELAAASAQINGYRSDHLPQLRRHHLEETSAGNPPPHCPCLLLHTTPGHFLRKPARPSTFRQLPRSLSLTPVPSRGIGLMRSKIDSSTSCTPRRLSGWSLLPVQILCYLVTTTPTINLHSPCPH